METTLVERFLINVFLWWKNNKIPFISSIISGMLAYMYAFTNKFVNHDEIVYLFGKGATYDSGRWGINIITYIFPNYSMPWLYGITGVILIAISTCLIVKIFEIDNTILQIGLASLITVFPSLAGVFTYIFTSSAYSLAFLLAVLSVYLFQSGIKSNKLKRYRNIVLSLLCMVFSLSLYQAYLSVVLCFFLLLCMKRVLNDDSSPKEVIVQGIRYILGTGIAVAIYYGVTIIVLRLLNTGFNRYANNYMHSKEILRIKIVNAYYAVFRELFQSAFALVPDLFSRFLHIALIALMAAESIIWLIKSKGTGKKYLYIILWIVFPLCLNCLFVITDSSAVHTLVLYGFISIYILPIIIHTETEKLIPDIKIRSMGKDVIIIVLMLFCCINIFVANKAYLKQNLAYENMYSFYTSLVSQIKSTPGFTEKSKIAILGETQNNVYEFNEFSSLMDFAGVGNFEGINVRNGTKQKFIKYYLGFDVEFASEQEVEDLSDHPAVLAMEKYPYYGSVQAVDEYVVVNFGD